ncbi:MAG: monovalent cation/H(+) antiporter subunit G [Desulfuromonadales bacterium]
MKDIVVAFIMVAGSGFIFLAALGMVRMPDVFSRMSCVAKAATMGLGLLLLGLAIYFGELGVTSRALATIGFVILTSPIASHRIGRVAYLDGAPLWEGTIKDELAGRYSAGAALEGEESPSGENREGEGTS